MRVADEGDGHKIYLRRGKMPFMHAVYFIPQGTSTEHDIAYDDNEELMRWLSDSYVGLDMSPDEQNFLKQGQTHEEIVQGMAEAIHKWINEEAHRTIDRFFDNWSYCLRYTVFGCKQYLAWSRNTRCEIRTVVESKTVPKPEVGTTNASAQA